MTTLPSIPAHPPTSHLTVIGPIAVMVVGSLLQVYFWVNLLILTFLELSKRKFIAPLSVLKTFSPWFVLDNAAPLLIVGLLLHAATLILLSIDSIRRPSPLLLFGWGLGTGVAAGVPAAIASTAFQSLFRLPWAMFAGLTLTLAILIGASFLYMHLSRRPNATGRQLIWLQTIILAIAALLIIPPVIWIALHNTHELFKFKLYALVGFPSTALILSLLTLAITRHRHKRLLEESLSTNCRQCAYNLTGTPSAATCPECGTPISNTAPTLN